MLRLIEEYVHVTPFFEFVLLFLLLLRSNRLLENVSESPETFKNISISSSVFSVVSFLIGNAFMCRSGRCGSSRLVETRKTLGCRYFNELFMILTCGCIFYLIDVSNGGVGGENEELRPLTPFYVLAAGIYLPATLMNLIVLAVRTQEYRKGDQYVSISS